jgi:hypothetical protein
MSLVKGYLFIYLFIIDENRLVGAEKNKIRRKSKKVKREEEEEEAIL